MSAADHPRGVSGLSVSVVIPCRNAAPWLPATLRSVLEQTRPVDEVVLVDDGSTDGSGDIAAAFSPIVRVVRQEGRGVSAARNRGVREAAGDVVAFLDADDLWHPEKNARQVDYLDRHPDVGAVVTSAVKFIDDPANQTRSEIVDDRQLRQATAIDLLVHCWVNQSTLAVRTPVARTVPYPEHTGDSEDMIQAAELRLHTIIGGVPDVLAFYRQHASQASKRADHPTRSLESRLDWAARNYARLGLKSATSARLAVLEPIADRIMPLYWRRDLATFRQERARLLRLWPAGEAVPPGLRRVVPPRGVLMLVDWIRSLGGRSSGRA